MTKKNLEDFMDASAFMEMMANKHPEIMKGWKEGTLMVEQTPTGLKIVEKQDYEKRHPK